MTDKQYDNSNQIGILWYKSKNRSDGSSYYFFSGLETKKNRTIFLFKNTRGKGNWKLMVSGEDPDSGQSKLIEIGILWDITKYKMEGKLNKGNKAIVAWRSKNKLDKLDKLRTEKNMGIISDIEYHETFEKIKKQPDISINYDDVIRKNAVEDDKVQREILKEETEAAKKDPNFNLDDDEFAEGEIELEYEGDFES